jgi:SAM-dependent methyltransferase
MSDWGGGYVTDVTYTTGWYSQQSPAIVAIAAIIGGARATVPSGDDPMQVMELGCGFGYAAMALAASNPSWSVVGVDFNPAHIAGAREWAAEAGLTNVRFIEADLSSWEDHPEMANLPEMDFITLHGVWSWVPPATRSGIVRLLARKVLPGGLVHVSYNSLPGWQSRLAAARVIREVGSRTGGRSDQQAREGLRVLKELSDAKAHFTGTSVANLIESLSRTSPSYLAHEFMNRQWAPCFAMDVADAFSEAKLEFVAASSLTDNFPDLTMTEEQRAIFNRYGDVGMRELVKDMCMARSLRHDVFVRGARRLNMAERANALMDVHLTLTAPVQELPEALIVPAGRQSAEHASWACRRFAEHARCRWTQGQPGGTDQHPDQRRHGGADGAAWNRSRHGRDALQRGVGATHDGGGQHAEPGGRRRVSAGGDTDFRSLVDPGGRGLHAPGHHRGG